MTIRFFEDRDRNCWDHYVQQHPGSNFFQMSGWKDVVEQSFGHRSYYLLYREHFRIKGVFPLFSVKSFLFGCSMVSVPFGAYGGILADNTETEQALFSKAVELTRKNRLDCLEIRNENDAFPELPGKDLYFVFKKEIYSDNDKNLDAIPRKARRMIRVAIKNGLKVRFGSMELLDTFYRLFTASYQRLGTPVFSKKYLQNILRQFKNRSNILIIYKGEKPLSGVLSFYYKDQVIPYYSGAVPDSQKYAANDYLYWVLMCDAADRGYRIFDFGRSKKGTGPFHFKRHWGFEPKLLHYQYYLNLLDEVPNISPANPKYKKKIELWKKLPLRLTELIGPQIVKYVP